MHQSKKRDFHGLPYFCALSLFVCLSHAVKDNLQSFDSGAHILKKEKDIDELRGVPNFAGAGRLANPKAVNNLAANKNLLPPYNPSDIKLGNGKFKELNIKYNPEVAGHARDPRKPKRKGQMRLGEAPDCADDVQRFCSEKANGNNFLILDCLQNDEKTHNALSDGCQHFLWQYKLNLTQNDGFDRAINRDCSTELEQFTDCKAFKEGDGMRVPCLIEHFDEVKSKGCRNFLNKMASIVFSDYRFMQFFMADCGQDVIKLGCGRVKLAEDDDSPHFQGMTVACLNKNRKQVSKKCKKSLLQVAEFQSDDFHLDRPLYYSCKLDRENLCPDVVAGEGAVFKCLYKHLGDKKLSLDCKEKLEARQQLISEDVKVDKTFYEACESDIQEYKCIVSEDADGDGDVDTDLSRSSVLLCLEGAQINGKKIQPECLQQMFELRSELMQDYKISPELVAACEKEIDKFCDALEEGGATIQCLITESLKVKNKGSFGHECKAKVSELLHVANPMEDIRLDRPLHRDCKDVYNTACKGLKPGNGEVITCLMENLDHEDMTDECEERLLEIQYFAVRDFRMDHVLFKACKTDAGHCHFDATKNPKDMTPDSGPLVFSCLHRFYKSKDLDDHKLSKSCTHEVKRMMRERSKKINLMPEVEEACMSDLSDICSDENEFLEKGGEMACLQNHLEELQEKCQTAVTEFTKEQSEDIEMDRVLMKACTPMMNVFCKDILQNSGMATEVLECLIEYKNHGDMNPRCAAGIEHHQLISLKDFRFNHKFREACETAVNSLCREKKTKYDVVACLSEHVRNDTLMESQQRVERRCRKQLRFELLQRGESISLDPALKAKCQIDVTRFCGSSNPGNAEVIECLKKHQKRLSPDCHRAIFKNEEVEAVMGDYALLHTCKKMIRHYCKMDMRESELLDCLKENKDNMDFDESCRKIVLRRQVEHAQDFRLNPHLQKACRLDIAKFCANIYDKANHNDELEGQVINCLKKKFISRTKSLTTDCEHEVKSIIKEAALDINQNPVLLKVCKTDIKHSCNSEIANVEHMEIANGDVLKPHSQGAIIECLKRNFQRLTDNACKKEVAFLITESRVDINVDPLLHSTCQKDLITLCVGEAQGQGRQMSCLLSHLENNPTSLSSGCHVMLSRRKDLWEYAAQVAPAESFSEIYDQVAASPSRNYFLAVMFSVVGVIFIVGITCGRVTKRVRAEVKNK